MATTATIPVPNGARVNALQPRELSMHYNPFVDDIRPRIKVSFLAHSQDIGFSLMLDTGSSVSHLVQARGTPEEAARLEHAPPSYLPEDGIDSSEEPVVRPAKWEEGYLNVGLVSQTAEGRDIVYGADGNTRAIPTTEGINEIAQLFSGSTSFVFEMNMYLTTGMDNRFTGVGLLGAGVTSDFARAVGVFAYMGPVVDYTGWALTSAGRLFLGQRDVSVLNTHCARGSNIVFFPLLPQISSIHWTVSGSTELVRSSNRIVTHEYFIVDTGAAGVYVSRAILDAVTRDLEASGAVLISALPGHLKKYTNCRIEALPNIIVRLGIGPQVVSVTVTPGEYIIRAGDPTAPFCFLDLSEGAVSGRARLVGMKVLSKLMTVFDSENRRIGFCNTRP